MLSSQLYQADKTFCLNIQNLQITTILHLSCHNVHLVSNISAYGFSTTQWASFWSLNRVVIYFFLLELCPCYAVLIGDLCSTEKHTNFFALHIKYCPSKLFLLEKTTRLLSRIDGKQRSKYKSSHFYAFRPWSLWVHQQFCNWQLIIGLRLFHF